MSEERFVVSTNDVGEIIVTDVETGKVYHYGSMSNFLGLIRLLNEQQATIKSKDKQLERWKTLYEIKDKEVTARVDALNRVCEYYTSEVQSIADVDPNEAVKEVINEILNTEVEMMSDCDNCIHTHYIDNEWYCLMGNRPRKECEDYRHWNGLSDEERDQCND